jgi:hypothetical protein
MIFRERDGATISGEAADQGRSAAHGGELPLKSEACSRTLHDSPRNVRFYPADSTDQRNTF